MKPLRDDPSVVHRTSTMTRATSSGTSTSDARSGCGPADDDQHHAASGLDRRTDAVADSGSFSWLVLLALLGPPFGPVARSGVGQPRRQRDKA